MKFIVACLLVLLSGGAQANASAPLPGTATVTWTAPLTNADGTTPVKIASFIVRYGTKSGVYDRALSVNTTATFAVLNGLAPGTWYFAVTAVDAAGNESSTSVEVSKTIAAPPAAKAHP